MSPGRAGRVPEYLQHVLDAIDRITNYVAGLDQATFARDLRTQDAVIRGIGVIGEASNKARAADPGIASRNPHIPWDLMYGMRNRVIHDYFEVDVEVVWQTIHRDLPVLREQIVALISELSAPK